MATKLSRYRKSGSRTAMARNHSQYTLRSYFTSPYFTLLTRGTMDTVITVLLLLSVAFLAGRIQQGRQRLPPGPKGWPVLGNLWSMPKNFDWLTYQKWSREFDSDIIYLRMFRTNVIVLNSHRAVRDLLDSRSNIYSDREQMVMMNTLMGWDINFAFKSYGEQWREQRRSFHQIFTPSVVTQYRPRISSEAGKLLKRLIDDPEDFMDHIRTTTGAIILGITYGMKIRGLKDPYVVLAENALHAMAMAGNAGSYLVDSFPVLRHLPDWFPGTKFKREASEWNGYVSQMFNQPFEIIRQKLDNGEAESSILGSLLTRLDPDKDNSHEERVIRGITGAAYTGGADTTVSSFQTFILAMLHYPEVQKKAHEELDRIVGADRLPEFEDKDRLPYIMGIMIETLRWRNVLPLAIPHRLMVDDEYKGYHLPAGSLIVANTWAILHDESKYPNPDVFDPSRYLKPDGQLDPNAPAPTEAAFGYGRRICPGRHFAMESLWVLIVYVLATLRIDKAKDADGKVIEPSGEYTSGMLSYPVRYKASFIPRSAASNTLIENLSLID
ncbi:hypothetical protein PHLGIDRAFT_332753 [Phlebiopsis gigantea 11061_1 CR5-6]|uniref:Cytochrome P450 n=1 Tax=Phlebiopsis gigantea (strain 11061_1 CR5-6) TaxID=745531 RepID=A0A0C3S7F5_PHLG1|nr:hypothetical protein PHLGIDRAFT_332753 [Phlebiopsis gigantea 11061_1 CR5-6]